MLKEWPTFQSERVLSRRAETDSNRSHIETAACVQILPAESKHLGEAPRAKVLDSAARKKAIGGLLKAR